MIEIYTQKVNEINKSIKKIAVSDNFYNFDPQQLRGFEAYRQTIQTHIEMLEASIRNRLEEEYFGLGPLKSLLEDSTITEIIINKYDSIWFEKEGKLFPSDDCFLSDHTFETFLQRLYLEIGQEPTLMHPFIDGSWKGNRIHIIGTYIQDQINTRVTLRKHRISQWTLNDLNQLGWAKEEEIEYLKSIVNSKKNILVIGPTGSGKTSIIKALLNECQKNERIVILEDSKEIEPCNEVSTHLLTRIDTRNIVSTITLTDLVKQSLRMRPDRIIVGEVRGGEAKDLLMALATGHHGSAATLHSSNPSQALIRLEMLIQMGASHWSLTAIRRLILLSLDYIILCSKNNLGQRTLGGVYKLVTLEESGIIIERIDF